MSPTSGPPGTTVSVSGTGCSPGLVLTSSQDFVQVSATTAPPSTTRFSVSTNGSWGGTFAVPAGAPALPAAVTALCFSDGLQSLLSIYLPKVFTVSAASPTTTVASATTTVAPAPTTVATTPSTQHTPPTTHPSVGSTTPGPRPPHGTPGTAAPGDPISTPGDGTGPIIGGIAGGGNGPGRGPGPGSVATTPTRSATKSVKASSDDAKVSAADLRAPGLPGSDSKGAAGLGWLAWLLVIVGLTALVTFGLWLYRSRRGTLEPDESAVLQ